GNFVSFLLFAVSPTFYIALGARSLNGMLAGNVAVMKSVMAEISDDSNRARVMALLPLVWNVGSVAGSAAGGVLADPAREGGMLEGVRVFRMFPYLLPCLVASCVTLVGLVLGTFVVRETLRKRGAEEGVPILGGRPRRGFRELMTPVVSSVMFNNAMSSLIVSMSDQVYPIFAATGRSDGGLGFDSREIGYSLAISGLAVFYLQLAVYPRMERRYGALGCYRRGLLVLVPYLVAMPWVSMVGRKGVVWPLLVGLLLVKVAGQVLMFTSINLLTVNLAPTREDLGFMNGVQQVAMSATRMLGPLMGGIARGFSRWAQAAVYSEPGDLAQVLRVVWRQLPLELEPTSVVVKMLAAPVNPSDLNQIEGTYPVRGRFSDEVLGRDECSRERVAVGGNEGVGVVEAVGSGVSDLRVGDWVVPRRAGEYGTWCTRTVVGRSALVEVPAGWRLGVDSLTVGSMKVNPCSAFRLLRDYAQLAPGDWIIQNGANSGVGRAVIQMARLMGVHTVNVVRDRSPEEYESLDRELSALGADLVVRDSDLGAEWFKKRVREAGPLKLGLNC
ncbi:mitochondrial 2-enoyl thioester reductase, partial [Coemansia sp. RSA 2671]